MWACLLVGGGVARVCAWACVWVCVGGACLCVAWSNVVRFMAREDTDPLRYVAVGYDEYGRLLEMVAVLDESDRWHVFHAMRATPKVLRELKLL